jgi:predicted phosphodiesterase
MSRVLVIGDTHFPAVLDGYLQFVKDIKAEYKCDTIVHIGDIVDHHCISFHAKHPDHPGAVSEYRNAMEQIKEWKATFKNMVVTIGNHDERVLRLAGDAGIPDFYLKTYNEVYNTKWSWVKNHTVDRVFYHHGTGGSSMYPSFNTAKALGMSVVAGHHHSCAGINWQVSPLNAIFGMNVGCGVDRKHIGMKYGENNIKKPVISCGVVINGAPYLELMPL